MVGVWAWFGSKEPTCAQKDACSPRTPGAPGQKKRGRSGRSVKRGRRGGSAGAMSGPLDRDWVGRRAPVCSRANVVRDQKCCGHDRKFKIMA